MCSLIWPSPLVDDRQPTYLTNLRKDKKTLFITTLLDYLQIIAVEISLCNFIDNIAHYKVWYKESDVKVIESGRFPNLWLCAGSDYTAIR